MVDNNFVNYLSFLRNAYDKRLSLLFLIHIEYAKANSKRALKIYFSFTIQKKEIFYSHTDRDERIYTYIRAQRGLPTFYIPSIEIVAYLIHILSPENKTYRYRHR